MTTKPYSVEVVYTGNNGWQLVDFSMKVNDYMTIRRAMQAITNLRKSEALTSHDGGVTWEQMSHHYRIVHNY